MKKPWWVYKIRNKNGNQYKINQTDYKCVLVSYDLGSLKKGEGVVVFEKGKLKTKRLYYERTRRGLLKNVQLKFGGCRDKRRERV